MNTYDCVVIGGGISGLSAAYTLYKRGLSVLVLEAGANVGGVMQSTRTPEGYTLDCGPNTLATKLPRLWNEFSDLGIADRVVAANRSGKRRYILQHGKPTEIPGSLPDMVTTPLLSFGAKLRMLREPFSSKGRCGEESVAGFFMRHIGPEPTANLIDPFVAGVYAGDPSAMSIQATFPALWEAEQRGGSIVRGMLTGRKNAAIPAVKPAKMRSVTFGFRNGLGEWPQAIARALGAQRVWTRARAVELRRAGDHWHVLVERGGPTEHVEAQSVILATPAYASAELVSELDPQAAAALRAIPYVPVSVVHLGYRREQIAHPLDGFGVLAPSHERRNFLGILWASSLFAGVAPEGRVLTITLMGGALRPDVARQSEQALIASAIADNADILGARGVPEMSHATRWDKAIPQYTFGHTQRIAALEKLEQAQAGIYFVGSYRGGVGAPKCWANGVATAEHAATYIGNAKGERQKANAEASNA